MCPARSVEMAGAVVALCKRKTAPAVFVFPVVLYVLFVMVSMA
jgi:hypothetical protein